MRERIAALHRPAGRYFRARRLRQFAQAFGLDSSTTVLDVGGEEHYWPWCPGEPQVTVVNLAKRDLRPEKRPWVQADGRLLPFGDSAFDVVYCNSVLEHLPDAASRHAMAREIARVGRGYWVQTPNRRFPVEPHLLTPGFHYLPKRWQVRAARNFSVWGWLVRPSPEEARGFVENIDLLGEAELADLFPGAKLIRERFGGLTKSLVAVRDAGG